MCRAILPRPVFRQREHVGDAAIDGPRSAVPTLGVDEHRLDFPFAGNRPRVADVAILVPRQAAHLYSCSVWPNRWCDRTCIRDLGVLWFHDLGPVTADDVWLVFVERGEIPVERFGYHCSCLIALIEFLPPPVGQPSFETVEAQSRSPSKSLATSVHLPRSCQYTHPRQIVEPLNPTDSAQLLASSGPPLSRLLLI